MEEEFQASKMEIWSKYDAHCTEWCNSHFTEPLCFWNFVIIVISAPCCIKPTAVIQREAVCSKYCSRE